VPSHIAEGSCRTQGDLGRFLQIAAGSASELEYQLLLANDLGLLEIAAFRALSEQTTEVKRMLAALLSRLTAEN
jgi:four helix bundle protein